MIRARNHRQPLKSQPPRWTIGTTGTHTSSESPDLSATYQPDRQSAFFADRLARYVCFKANYAGSRTTDIGRVADTLKRIGPSIE